MEPRSRAATAWCVVAAGVLIATPPAHAAERPEVLSVHTPDERTVSVSVRLPGRATRDELRGTTLALPERTGLPPRSVTPVWSRDLALAVVLPPPASLEGESGAASASVAADLLLQMPTGGLTAVLSPGDPPAVLAPLDDDPLAAVTALRERPTEGRATSAAAVRRAAAELRDAPRAARAVVVLAPGSSLVPTDVPQVRDDFLDAGAILHVVHMTDGPTSEWDRLVAAVGGESVRADEREITAVDPVGALRRTHLLTFKVPPGPIPSGAQLHLPPGFGDDSLQLQLPQAATSGSASGTSADSAEGGLGAGRAALMAALAAAVALLLLVLLVLLARRRGATIDGIRLPAFTSRRQFPSLESLRTSGIHGNRADSEPSGSDARDGVIDLEARLAGATAPPRERPGHRVLDLRDRPREAAPPRPIGSARGSRPTRFTGPSGQQFPKPTEREFSSMAEAVETWLAAADTDPTLLGRGLTRLVEEWPRGPSTTSISGIEEDLAAALQGVAADTVSRRAEARARLVSAIGHIERVCLDRAEHPPSAAPILQQLVRQAKRLGPKQREKAFNELARTLAMHWMRCRDEFDRGGESRALLQRASSLLKAQTVATGSRTGPRDSDAAASAIVSGVGALAELREQQSHAAATALTRRLEELSKRW